MRNIGIFYGSSTGTTATIAHKIAKQLDVPEEDIHNVAEAAPSSVQPYDVLVFGTSTWGNGDVQVDWIDFLKGLEVMDLSKKKIALFGCGDETMTDTFCNGVGIIYDALRESGADFIAPYDTVGYEFHHTSADLGGMTVGLLLDEVNHPEATDLRLRGWVTKVKEAI